MDHTDPATIENEFIIIINLILTMHYQRIKIVMWDKIASRQGVNVKDDNNNNNSASKHKGCLFYDVIKLAGREEVKNSEKL